MDCKANPDGDTALNLPSSRHYEIPINNNDTDTNTMFMHVNNSNMDTNEYISDSMINSFAGDSELFVDFKSFADFDVLKSSDCDSERKSLRDNDNDSDSDKTDNNIDADINADSSSNSKKNTNKNPPLRKRLKKGNQA